MWVYFFPYNIPFNHVIRSGKLKYVQLGQHDINSNISDAEVQNFIISQTYTHPDFQYLSVYNDIGLVELATPVEFTQFISPACLAVSGNFDNPSLQTVGYGLLQLREKLGKHLVQLSPVEDCKQIYASNPVIRSDNVEVICSKVIDENGECYVSLLQAEIGDFCIHYELNFIPDGYRGTLAVDQH